MSELATFLLARIAEDEEAARDALDVDHVWLVEDNSIGLWPDDREPVDGYLSFPRRAHARHAAHWSPARVLAECEAKRRIVGELSETGWLGRHRLLAALALPYADDPDYRSEWAQ